jgi:hypothetical protein
MSPVVRANWLLTGLILLLASWAWLDQHETAFVQTVTALNPAKIIHVQLWKEKEPVAELVRENGQWHWRPGGKAVEEREWVNRLLHFAELPSLHRFPADEARLVEFGLKPPRYRLQLDDQHLEFGSLDPASGLRYLRVGDTIHLITDSYTHELSRIPDA